MKERLYLIFTEGGFIGTILIFENDTNIFTLIDLFGYFEDQGIIYLDSEIHQKFSFNKGTADSDVLEESLIKLIPNYDKNKLHYLWSDKIDPNKFNPHPIKR